MRFTKIILRSLVVILGLYSQLALAKPTLEIWTSSENIQRALMSLIEHGPFKDEIDIKVTVLNKDLTGQFKTAALTQKGPDIFCWAHDVVGELASSGLLEPIILPPELEKALIPSALEALKYGGQLYGYPYNVESVALITNPTLLPTVPATFEELANWAETFQQQNPGSYGFLFDFKNFFFSFPFLNAQGGYIFATDDTGSLNIDDIGLNHPGAVKGLEFLSQLKTRGLIPSSTDRSIAFDSFRQGKLAAMIDGPWAISDLKRAQVPFEVHPLPKLGGSISHPFGGSHAFFVRRSSPLKVLAMELIERVFMTPEGISHLYQHDPRGPSRSDALRLITAQMQEHDRKTLQGFNLSASDSIPMPNIPQMGSVWSAMGQALNSAIGENRSAKESLEHAVAQIQASLKKEP